ncbi:MAG: methyltransferase domain-containing protein [Deltaproteobacteria bacterium]|nr:methyltransferase domain-containing protein [Deltaproteobacteria bacterium]
MAASPCDVDPQSLREAVQDVYARVATAPEGSFHFHRGPHYATSMLGYSAAALATLAPQVTAAFSGVGNPLGIAALGSGMTVVDVGCGSGTDLLLAARAVGPSGRAIGIEMTPAMAELARRGALIAGLDNVEVRLAEALALPVDTESADVVLSNGVVNLIVQKETALREMFRVLRPDGMLLLADIALDGALGSESRGDIDLWTG